MHATKHTWIWKGYVQALTASISQAAAPTDVEAQDEPNVTSPGFVAEPPRRHGVPIALPLPRALPPSPFSFRGTPAEHGLVAVPLLAQQRRLVQVCHHEFLALGALGVDVGGTRLDGHGHRQHLLRGGVGLQRGDERGARSCGNALSRGRVGGSGGGGSPRGRDEYPIGVAEPDLPRRLLLHGWRHPCRDKVGVRGGVEGPVSIPALILLMLLMLLLLRLLWWVRGLLVLPQSLLGRGR